MEELKLGMKPVKKHWHFDKRKASNPQITKTKRFSDGRVFIDYPDGRKIIRMPDGTERERTL
ncbi:hypothetical protein EBX31_12195 [bacterium]|nr:hypothetical protein [bacterium]